MKRQPLLFGSAAVVTLWSAWIVMHGSSGGAAPDPARLRVMPAPAPASAAGAVPAVAKARTARQRIAEVLQDDAFAARSWVVPPPPPPPPPPPAPAPPPAPPAPPPLPTLPYRFVGLLDEGRAGKPQVFLALGDKLLVAKVGDRLEGGFQLVSISAHELVFSHLQQNVTLKLSVAGGSS